jgi:alkanesulfonate monooxygenase SsuD/methylene tetrahydromethanopterin reductase-like flavin-dependent oxidoreductase (luciferase family)
VAAEQIGIDGAFVRVHHFARQLSSPFPLLAAIGVKTSRIEIGTGVIDMRYENPLYMAEEAAAADLLARGRLQLGVSRGSPEPAWQGAEAFGYPVDSNDARDKTALFRKAIAGAGVVASDIGGKPGGLMLAVQPHSPGLVDRIWWGSGTRESAVWVAEQGMNLMSSTLLLEDTQVPFDELQAEQITLFHEAWQRAGHERNPRVSVSRSVMPITSDLDRRLFGRDANEDQVGWLDGAISRFGRARPDRRRTGQGRRRAGGRHRSSHRAKSAWRRVQRADAGDDRPRGGAGIWLEAGEHRVRERVPKSPVRALLITALMLRSGPEGATHNEVHRDKTAQAAACAQQVPGAIR